MRILNSCRLVKLAVITAVLCGCTQEFVAKDMGVASIGASISSPFEALVMQVTTSEKDLLLNALEASLPGVPAALSFSPDGKRLYVGYFDVPILTIFDLSNLVIEHEIQSIRPIHRIIPDDVGKYVYFIHESNDYLPKIGEIFRLNLDEMTVEEFPYETSMLATDGVFLSRENRESGYLPPLLIADPNRTSLLGFESDWADQTLEISLENRNRGPYLSAGAVYQLELDTDGLHLLAIHVPESVAAVSIFSKYGELVGAFTEVYDLWTLAAGTLHPADIYEHQDHEELLITVNADGDLVLRRILDIEDEYQAVNRLGQSSGTKRGFEFDLPYNALDTFPIPIDIKYFDTASVPTAVQLLTSNQSQSILVVSHNTKEVAIFGIEKFESEDFSLRYIGNLIFRRPIGASSVTRDGSMFAFGGSRSRFAFTGRQRNQLTLLNATAIQKLLDKEND